MTEKPPTSRVAGVGLEQAGEDGDGGGLAGAVGAEQAEDLALFDGERDVVDRDRALGRVELLAEAFDLRSLSKRTSPRLLPACSAVCGVGLLAEDLLAAGHALVAA